LIAQFSDRKITYTRNLAGLGELIEGLLSTGARRIEIEKEWA
jgi:hypothetical protein